MRIAGRAAAPGDVVVCVEPAPALPHLLTVGKEYMVLDVCTDSIGDPCLLVRTDFCAREVMCLERRFRLAPSP